MSDDTKQTIFGGLTILDLTKVYSGPLATRYLADYGATVIKIENPESPDPARYFPPLKNAASGYFEILNRNKSSLLLNLKNPTDLEKFYALVKTSDIVVENMSPHAKQSLHVDCQTLQKYNPRLIYASLAGKDQESNDKYFDVIAQAESGLMSLSGSPDTPTKIGPAVIDAFGGINLAFALASALYHRSQTGQGQEVQVSMLATAMNLLEQNLVEYSIKQKNPARVGNHDNAIAPFGIYPTQDAQLALAIGSDSLWQTFIAIEEWNYEFANPLFSTNDLRLQNQTKLTRLIEKIFTQFSTKTLLKILKDHNIPSAKIAEMSDIAANPWFYQHDALRKIRHPQLGECIVPGFPIKFSKNKNVGIANAPVPIVEKNTRQIIPLKNTDLTQITSLLDLCFAIQNPAKKELINWKYFDDTYATSLCAYGIYDQSNLVAFYANKQMLIQDKSKSYKAGICLDMCTHPEFRGQKLISQLSTQTYDERTKAGYDFALGFSNTAGVQVDKYASKYGYQVIGQFYRYCSIALGAASPYQVKVAQKLHNWPALQSLHFTQSKNYLEWRYLHKPNNAYKILDILHRSKRMGQAVVIESRFKLEIFKLILSDINDARACITALKAYAHDHHKPIVVIRVLPNQHWEKILRTTQFFACNFAEKPYYLTIKTLRHGEKQNEYIKNPDSWFLMGGDVL